MQLNCFWELLFFVRYRVLVLGYVMGNFESVWSGSFLGILSRELKLEFILRDTKTVKIGSINYACQVRNVAHKLVVSIYHRVPEAILLLPITIRI